FVREGAARALDAARQARAALAAGVEGRIDVDQVEALPARAQRRQLRQTVGFQDVGIEEPGCGAQSSSSVSSKGGSEEGSAGGSKEGSEDRSESSSPAPSPRACRSSEAGSQLQAGPPPWQPCTLACGEQAMRKCRWSS